MITTEYLLDLDIKHETAIQTPIFRRGDSAILKFRIHDRDINYQFRNFDKAEVTLVMPSGIKITENCVKQQIEGIDIARFEFKKIHSIEVGIYKIYLSITQGNDRVSVPPFPIEIDDNVSKEDYEFMEIIAGLEDQIESLKEQINNGVALDTINVANGVAGLDAMKKIPKALLLDYFENHISTSMYKDGAHGFRLDENRKPWVLVNGVWKEAKYSDKPMGAGSPMPIPTITVQNGYAIVIFKEPVNLSLRKWTYGLQNATWFRTNGTTASTNTFPVSQIGEHTFYYKLEDGRDNTVVFQVTKEGLDSGTVKPIEEFKDGDLVKFGNLEWVILDKTKRILQTRYSVGQRIFGGGALPFTPIDPQSSLAYWLNNDFYNNTFTVSEKEKIVSRIWNVGSDSYESSLTSSGKIGLLSLSQYNSYSNIVNSNLSENDGTFTLTGDSSSTTPEGDTKIWYIKKAFGNLTIETINKDTVIGQVKPLIYLQEKTLVEPIIKDENIPLSQFNDGDMVKFSDRRWRILDKAQGLIIYDDIPIYRPVKNIWENFLNTSFYLDLNSQAKSFIQPNDWDLSNPTETPMSSKITSYIGLLSLPMFNTYKNKLSHLLESRMFWTSTKGQIEGLQVAINTTDGYFGNYVQVSQDFDYQVVPVVKVAQNTTFGKLKEEAVELSTIAKGQQVWLSNYPWIKGNNNDLILNYDYLMDAEPVAVPFSGDANSDYFSITANREGALLNASKDVNTKFLLERLFYRVSKNLTDKEFNIGFADNPTSQKGFSKAGLINTNTWNDDYKSNLPLLKVSKDFWLLNPKNADEAYYVSATDLSAKTASVTDILKITKPVLRLEPTAKVQQYVKDEEDFAYIPDPVVRGQLNLNLGKGSANNPDTSQITIEEMQSITFFDSLNLVEATDLTGLELLTNCTFIRILHNPDKSFNITNFAPLIKLGESKTLNKINIYGVPEGDPSLSIYSQLKGKFPHINEGGVYTGAYLKILISLAELKGLAEGVYVLPQDEMFPYNNNSESQHIGYFYYSTFRAWGKKPITHVKGFHDSDYVALSEPTFEYRTFTRPQFEMPSLHEGTDVTLYQAWAKDGDGNELKVFIQFTQDWGIYWNDRDMKPHIVITREKATLTENITLPNVINGIPMYSFGHMGGGILSSQKTIKSISIPSNYQEIWDVFAYCRSLGNVYFTNQQIQFNDKYRAFMKPSDGEGVDITFHGQQNSTIYDFYQYKISNENPQDASIKSKYKFALLP